MARGHRDRVEAKRSAKEDQRQERGLAQRVGRLEQEMKQITAKAPARPEDVVAGRAADVAATMSRLGGRRVTELAPDKERGAGSPSGHGTGSGRRG